MSVLPLIRQIVPDGPPRGLDRAGVVLSGLCVLHCLATVLLVSALGLGGHFLLAPAFHEVGLALAILVAAVATGWSALRHRMITPVMVALAGLGSMGAALAGPHGAGEIVLTVIGVTLVACAHMANLRRPS
jgi:hypothetical protein